MEHIHLIRRREFDICFGMNDLSAAHGEVVPKDIRLFLAEAAFIGALQNSGLSVDPCG